MMGEVLVKFRCSCADFAEVIPWGIGEIMVLNVVAEIKVEDVPNAEVIIGFLSLDEFIVLSENVDSCGVRSN
jgi:hypothetical protein